MSKTRIHETLKATDLFKNLAPSELEKLKQITCPKELKKHDFVFHEGNPIDAFFFIVSGLVKAYKIGTDGKEVILHLLEANTFFAECPVFGNQQAYPVSTVCLEPTTVLAIQADAFRKMVADQPEILMKMLASFSQRLQAFSLLIEDLSLRSVDARLAKYILSYPIDEQNNISLAVPKKTIAATLGGTIPETLSRGFHKLQI